MKTRNTWIMFTSAIVAFVIVITIIALEVYDFPRYSIIRAAALLGYCAVFVTCMSSLYMRQLTQFFGRPFIKTHHIIAVSGLFLLAVHAVFNAWYAETLVVFIPKVESLREFLAHGGRAALILLIIAALAALLRARLGRNWRIIHWLNYLAFLIATFHAFSLGTDFRYLIVRIVALVMACLLVVSFVMKRIQLWRRAQRKLARSAGHSKG